MSNATNLSKLANLLDDGTTGQTLVSDGASNVAFETLSTSNVSEGTNLYFTDERVQTKLGSVSGNVVPDTNVAYDLGSAAYAFKDLYLSGSTINLGSLQLSDNGGALEISPTGGGSAEPFATETYVTTQVNNLIDAAPGTLDTLNELASALGDDANFSTTVTNSIAAKANTSSLATVATSGSFSDLTGKPTTIAGYGITDAGAGGNVVEYTSSPNASVNDVVMLNSNGTVTPIAVTTFKTNKDVPQAQIIPNSTGWVYNQTNGAYDQNSDNAVLFPLGISNKYFFMGRDDSSGTAELSGAIVDWTGTTTNSGSWSTWNNPGWTYGTKYSGQSGFGGFARPAFSNKEKPFVIPSPLDANKFLLVQRLHDSEKVIAQIGTITGSTVAWSNHTELDIAIHYTSYVRHLYDPANSSSGNYAFYTVVNSDSAGRVRIVRGVWDGNTTITFGPGTSSGDHNGWQFPSDAIDPRSISFSKITANRCTAVNRTTGEIAIYDLSTTINSTTSAVTKGTAQPLSSFQWDGIDLEAHTSWNYNRDEFVVWWRTAGNTQDNNSIMQNYEVSSTNPVYPIAKGTNLNLANHIQFKNGDFEFISGSDTIFTTYLQEWIGLGGEHSHRAVISIDPSSGNLTTLDKDIAYSQDPGEPGVFSLANNNNAQFEGTISVDHFRKGQAVMTNPHYNNSTVWQVAGSPIVGTYVQSNIDATKIHGIATTSGSYPDVTVEGGIHTGLSGLTAGTTYFVLENGTISATADTHNARLGIAMTSTSLAVDLVNELTSTSLATYATKAYVDTATANLVDSAPATLDTLNELAAALGDDANFSTTITNSLANKADTSSLATVATSGSYNDLTNQPTIPSGDSTVISYSSTSSASTNDVMMLNTDGTVTPVEVTTFPTAVNGAAPVIVPSSTRLAGSTNDGSVVGDAPNHLFKLDGNKYLSVGRHEGGASNFYGVYSAVAEYNSGSWTWGNVYDMNNTNWGTINWNSEYYNDPYVLRSPDNPDKFLFFKLKTGGSFAAIIGTVSGLTVSWSDYSQPSQNYPSPTNNSYNVKTEYDYAGSSAGNYKFIVWYGTASDMKAFRVVWNGNTTITWEDEVTISTGNSGTVPNGNINPVSASFSRVTEGRLCVHNYTTGSLQVYDIDWVNGTTQVGNNFSITASSLTSGTSNYYGVDVKTAWNPLTDEVISINRLASGNPNIRFRRYNVNTSRTITANGNEFLPGQSTPFYSSSTFWLNGDFKFFPKSNVVFFSHARKDGTYDLNAIHYLATDNSSSFTEEYGIWTNYGLSGINWPFAARMYPDPFSSGQGSMSYTDRTSGVSRLEGKPLQGEYVESNLNKSKIHGLAATSGTTPDVTTQFGVHSGLSGLTVGSKYYVLDDGTLSTTPDTHNAKIGVAVKSTHIALDFIDELTVSDLTTYATKAYVGTEIAIKANTSSLATVATSGSYNDLTNQPTIPSLTGYATETYVNTATANLVDSAPATLDTLNELAAALGDDANFSTTILAQLGTVSANTISNASNINTVQANLSASASTAAVTVSGGNFYIDGAQQTTISLEPGRTYKFDQSDSTNSSHPLRFSTTSDGTHGGGSEYTTGVTTSGTAGSASAYVQIEVDNSTPALYYYCANHSGMGASVAIGNPFNTDELTEGTSNLYYTDARVDARVSANVALADLNNVSNTAPADGQALIWNTSQSNWAPANVASGGSSVSVSDTAPSSPSNGDQWFNSADGSMYIYYADGSSNQWVSVSGPAGSTVSVGTTPPSGAANGDQWFNSDSATLYVYYADGSSSQWVAVSGPRGPQGPAVQNAVTTGKAIAMSIVFG